MRKQKQMWLQQLVRAQRVLRPPPPESCLKSNSRIEEPTGTPAAPAMAPSSGAMATIGLGLADAESPFEHCACEPEPFFHACSPRPAWVSLSIAVFAFIIGLAAPGYSAVHEVGPVGLTVNNLDKEIAFYTEVLPFELVSRRQVQGEEADKLLGLPHAELREAKLRLGDETITLTEHRAKGQLIPADSRSFDHWFQHLAIVVRDMDQAYAALRSHKVKHVSTAPQTLPDWIKGAAGIRAFYFRDPEDHILEIIWFPKGKGDPKWQSPSQALFLGIDHTAIVVADTERSLSFYRDQLGFHVAGESENYGVEQEHLNQVFGAHLRITALRAEHGPGIEFLEYLTPPGGRDLPPDERANDLLFWRIELSADHIDALAEQATAQGKAVSRGIARLDESARERPLHGFILRDPDGHALQLEERERSAITAQK